MFFTGKVISKTTFKPTSEGKWSTRLTCMGILFVYTAFVAVFEIDQVPVSGRWRIRQSDLFGWFGTLRLAIGANAPIHIMVGSTFRDKYGKKRPLLDQDIMKVFDLIMKARGKDYQVDLVDDWDKGHLGFPNLAEGKFTLLVTRDDGEEEAATYESRLASLMALQLAYADNRVPHECDLAQTIPSWLAGMLLPSRDQGEQPSGLVEYFSRLVFRRAAARNYQILDEIRTSYTQLLSQAGFTPYGLPHSDLMEGIPENAVELSFVQAASAFVETSLHIQLYPAISQLSHNPHMKMNIMDRVFYFCTGGREISKIMEGETFGFTTTTQWKWGFKSKTSYEGRFVNGKFVISKK